MCLGQNCSEQRGLLTAVLPKSVVTVSDDFANLVVVGCLVVICCVSMRF